MSTYPPAQSSAVDVDQSLALTSLNQFIPLSSAMSISSDSSSSSSAASTQIFQPTAPGDMVTLQVGERRFRTLKSTLVGESTYFASMFSGRWPLPQTSTGKIFIDANPDLFQHILNYLRRGIFPLFYTNANGFDLGLYAALLHESRYFGIRQLEAWIHQKHYRRAVTVTYTSQVFEENHGQLSDFGDGEKQHHPTWIKVPTYFCPRGVSFHNGNPGACGRSCERARNPAISDYKDILQERMVVVTKRTALAHAACKPTH